jgi:hypothetical protein
MIANELDVNEKKRKAKEEVRAQAGQYAICAAADE